MIWYNKPAYSFFRACTITYPMKNFLYNSFYVRNQVVIFKLMPMEVAFYFYLPKFLCLGLIFIKEIKQKIF